MGGYIRASGFVLYPYVFVVGPNKHDCSRRTRLRRDFCHGPNWSLVSQPALRTGIIVFNHSHFSFVCYQMLYLLPDELLVDIVEHCDQKTRKSLSLVSRRLRNPSQHTIFKTLYTPNTFQNIVPPGFAVRVGWDRFSEVIQNDRLLSYIQTFIIRGGIMHRLEVNTMELLFTALHRMQLLRDIKLFDIRFTTTMLDRLFEVLSTRPYNVELWSCLYLAEYTFQQATLKIHRLWLDFRSIGDAPRPATSNLLVAIIEMSLSSI